jgi:Rhs element Vgr protein
MADSPNLNTDGPVRFSICCAGAAQENLPVVSAKVRHAFNGIPWARIVLVDGDMPDNNARMSDCDLFEPGAEITLKAGYGDIEETIFMGIVVRHGIRIAGDNESRLIVECCAKACRMAAARRTAHHVGQTDGEIIRALIGNTSVGASVAETLVRHEVLVQYDCSDWDFMLARADAMGLLVNVEGATVSVQPPPTNGSAAFTLTRGTDLIDFDAEIDARTQWTAVQAASWNPNSQSLLRGKSAAGATLTCQGNLNGTELAAVASPDILGLQTCAPQPKEMLDAWAQAVQVKAALARVRGRMSFQGNPLARPGALVELAGVGKRFSGTVLLSAVEHEIGAGNWISRAEFGMEPRWKVQRSDVLAAPNGGLLPGVGGLQIGVVLALDGDPAGEHRILVSLPAAQAADKGIWARLLHLHASSGFGSYFVPEVGDEVLLGHLNQDPCHPVVLGSLYSSSRTPPHALTAKNDIKAIVTRSGNRIEFDDADDRITVTTAAKNQLVLSDREKGVVVKDQSGNSIQLSAAGIALDSIQDITLVAHQGGITLDAVGAIAIRSRADVKLEGLNVACHAQVGVSAKGNATAELSASGQTTVRGAMVMIN